MQSIKPRELKSVKDFPLGAESGGVLVMFVLLAAVLVFMAGLTIDSARISASHSQQRSAADYIALAALEAYFKTSISPTLSAKDMHQARLAAALTRAGEIGNINFMVGQPKQPQTAKSGTDLNVSNSYVVNGDGSRGLLTYGTWHFSEPSGGCHSASKDECPCVATDNGDYEFNGPCFSPGALTDTTLNSFRVELKTAEWNPIKTVFTNIKGVTEVGLHASAIAAVSPRRIVFLIDLSRSVVEETHRMFPPDNVTQHSSFAFALHGGVSCGKPHCGCYSDLDHENPCPVAGQCGFTADYTGFVAEKIYDGHFNAAGEFKGVPDVRPTDVVQPRTSHYKDDYTCHIVRYTEDGAFRQEHYLVDTEYYEEGDSEDQYTYLGPQPLTDIFVGISAAVEGMKTRVVAGDMIGMVGFDQSAELSERTFELAEPGTAWFEELAQLITVDAKNSAFRAKRISKMFFPRPFSDTDIPEALGRARDMLKTAGTGNGVQNMVVLFTDGLTNCSRSVGCLNDVEHWQRSVEEVSDVITDKRNGYLKHRIPLHVVLVGESIVGPHTVIRKSKANPDKCMGDFETRNYYEDNPSKHRRYISTVKNTHENYLQGMQGISPFYSANEFWHYSRMTGGLWVPLRSVCEMKSCAKSQVRECLDDLCAKAKNSYALETEWTDDDGRLRCDPDGNDRVRQMQELMNTILHKNPYTLVAN